MTSTVRTSYRFDKKRHSYVNPISLDEPMPLFLPHPLSISLHPYEPCTLTMSLTMSMILVTGTPRKEKNTKKFTTDILQAKRVPNIWG